MNHEVESLVEILRKVAGNSLLLPEEARELHSATSFLPKGSPEDPRNLAKLALACTRLKPTGSVYLIFLRMALEWHVRKARAADETPSACEKARSHLSVLREAIKTLGESAELESVETKLSLAECEVRIWCEMIWQAVHPMKWYWKKSEGILIDKGPEAYGEYNRAVKRRALSDVYRLLTVGKNTDRECEDKGTAGHGETWHAILHECAGYENPESNARSKLARNILGKARGMIHSILGRKDNSSEHVSINHAGEGGECGHSSDCAHLIGKDRFAATGNGKTLVEFSFDWKPEISNELVRLILSSDKLDSFSLPLEKALLESHEKYPASFLRVFLEYCLWMGLPVIGASGSQSVWNQQTYAAWRGMSTSTLSDKLTNTRRGGLNGLMKRFFTTWTVPDPSGHGRTKPVRSDEKSLLRYLARQHLDFCPDCLDPQSSWNDAIPTSSHQ